MLILFNHIYYIYMIKFVCFDFDGVFTNNNVIINNNRVIKQYNCRDGFGIKMLKENNIITGVISAHKITNTNVSEIIEHLGIDYYSQGDNKKLKIIKKWINELNIDISEVAYIGDDISDIELLDNVGLSSCPNDAVSIVRDRVDFICNKKGGEGCVREFIEYILNIKSLNINTIDQIRNETKYILNNFPDISFIINKIVNNSNNIFLTGVGKSENIAIHCCNLMKSIGIKAFYINILNLSHGDIGCINNNDIIILFSKSGNTDEIINNIDNINCYKIGICCNIKSKFNKYCDYTLVLPHRKELINNKDINCIPTNSYTSQLFFVNILINELICRMDLNLDIYKKYHPAGNIGNNLKTIKDIIIYEYPKILLNININLNTILLEMTKYNIGCCFFINTNNKLIGLLTDGDIRRLILNNNIDNITINNLNKNYKYINDENICINSLNKDEYKKYKYIPIIKNDIIIGIIDCRDI